MKNHRKFAGFVFVMLFLFSLSPASAQVSFTDDEAAFLAANPNLLFQDFEATKVGPGNVEPCNVPVDSNSNDNCFSPGDILPGIAFLNGPIFAPPDLIVGGQGFVDPGLPPGPVLLTNEFADDFEIVFEPGVSRVGLRLGCASKGPCDADVQLFIFNTNAQFLAETTVHVTSAFDTFLGISSSALIQNISIRNPDPNTTSLKGLLNIRFGNAERNIPTLSEWGMIAAAAGLMLVGVFFAVRRRRASINL
jgi:hypothetical protein